MLVSVSSSLRTGAGKESLGQTFEGIELENFLAQQKKRKSEEKEEKSKLQKIKKVATGPSRRSDTFYLRD